MNYSDQRQTEHLADPTGTEEALSAVAEALGSAWLRKAGDEPLRDLWRRRDALATNQLVILGKSIIDARQMDARWTEGQIRKLKTDRNNSKGAAWEIVALSMLDVEGRRVRPTRSDAPGYDAIVTQIDGSEMAFSFKNYGTSTHEQRFRAEAATLEATFVSHLRQNGKSGLVLVAFADVPPTKEDWGSLRSVIPGLISSHDGSRDGIWKGGIWNVRTLDPPDDVRPLSASPLSHQVLVAAPFHANEEKNLIDKLEEAAANARRHATSIGNMDRAVLIHVPETFPLQACANWAEQYFSRNPDSPIGRVILHQLQVSSSGENSTMVHTFAIRLNLARRPGPVMGMKPHIGLVSIQPSPICFRGAEGVTLERMYLLQHGEFWTDFTGSGRGFLSNPAPGIFKHAVMRSPDGSEIPIRGIFPPSGSVTLLD